MPTAINFTGLGDILKFRYEFMIAPYKGVVFSQKEIEEIARKHQSFLERVEDPFVSPGMSIVYHGETNLRGAILSGLDMSYMDLSFSHLTGAKFDKTKVIGMNIYGVSIEHSLKIQLLMKGAICVKKS